MTFTLNEPIITELVARLQADLPGHIGTINGRITDGITISAPENVYDFIPPPGVLTSYPTIGIGDAPGKFEDDIGSSATGVFEILIVVYEQAGDQRELAWKLRRQAQAVTSAALATRKLPSGWGMTLREVAPGPTLGDDADNPQEWMSWVGVRIVVKTDEQ